MELKNKLFALLNVLLMIGLAACGSEGSGSSLDFTATGTTAGNFKDLSEYDLVSLSPLSFGSPSAQVSLNQGNDTHLFVINAANTTSSSFTIQLSAQSNPAASAPLPALSFEEENASEEELFHEFLMEMGVALSESEEVIEPARSSLGALKAAKAPAETRTFKVLSSMTSITQCKEVTAKLRFKTDHVCFYVDEKAADEIDDKTIEELANDFENISLPRAHKYFGEESDIDGDSCVSFLVTPVVNGMATSGGLVTGFYFPGDQYSASNTNPCSNKMEIMYVLSPDRQGTWGPPISVSFTTENILPGVLAHEFQHMISFNQHVLVNNGSTEKPWLNEAFSHLMEDLAGHNHENPSRVKLFLDKPNTTSIIPATSPRLAERGAGYLFLRYLYEQHSDGKTLLNCLSNTSRTGTDNIANCFGAEADDFDEFGELLHHFSLAVVLEGTGLSNDPRHNFDERGTDPETGNLTGICLRCEANDERGTVLKGPSIQEVEAFPVTSSLYSGATQYLLLNGGPASIAIQSSGSPDLRGSLVVLR